MCIGLGSNDLFLILGIKYRYLSRLGENPAIDLPTAQTLTFLPENRVMLMPRLASNF